jgi:predicted DCC family thiol-disulfide oxidoreductase YuxK
MSSRSEKGGPAFLVYDEECPFCSRYVRLLRLREAVGPVELVNARADHPVVYLLQDRGVNLDEGMALVQGDHISVGDDCIHKLALMSTRSGVFNRINGWVFRSPSMARVLYPVLRAGRNMGLRLLGRSKINS